MEAREYYLWYNVMQFYRFETNILQTKEEKNVGFTTFFLRFVGSDVSTTTHSLSNQTFYWSNIAL